MTFPSNAVEVTRLQEALRAVHETLTSGPGLFKRRIDTAVDQIRGALMHMHTPDRYAEMLTYAAKGDRETQEILISRHDENGLCDGMGNLTIEEALALAKQLVAAVELVYAAEAADLDEVQQRALLKEPQ